jgi:hypothetical protein
MPRSVDHDTNLNGPAPTGLRAELVARRFDGGTRDRCRIAERQADPDCDEGLLEVIGDGQRVDGFGALQRAEEEGAGRSSLGRQMARHGPGNGFGVAGRAVVELDAGLELEGQRLVVIAEGPALGEARQHFAVEAGARQRLIDHIHRRRRHRQRGLVRIERVGLFRAADAQRAAGLLGQCLARQTKHGCGRERCGATEEGAARQRRLLEIGTRQGVELFRGESA